MAGEKKPNARRQDRLRESMRLAGKKQLNFWVDSETKAQFERIKELLECNSDTAFETLMKSGVQRLSDKQLIRRLKGR